MQIRTWRTQIIESTKERNFAEAISLSHQVIDGLEFEGLTPMLAEYHEILARLYFATARKDEAIKHGNMGLAVLKQFGGTGSEPQVKKLEQIIKDISRST
jgi:hypothetical protein